MDTKLVLDQEAGKMVVSVHLADLGIAALPGFLRSKRRIEQRDGALYAEPAVTAPLGAGRIPRPAAGRAGLIAAWDGDAALDAFLAEDPVAARFAGGWHVRLEPVHVFGSWAGLPGLPERAVPVDDEEPVVVLTLGRLRLRRIVPFLRSAAPAERAAVAAPGLLASSGLARPPHLVSTFSVWRSAAAMRDYAFGRSGAHQAAVGADRRRPFHRESAFIRFRPYASAGAWDGADPLSGFCRGRGRTPA
ncbi:MAG TPA: hypothetical protein VFJ99_00210 [Solirubrobacterales bacterium]|nr:hypothetical protein [Solirubrobacterales bacterium]